jgi:hypothetical protein
VSKLSQKELKSYFDFNKRAAELHTELDEKKARKPAKKDKAKRIGEEYRNGDFEKLILIPVVVHVLDPADINRISEAQVQSQIQVLNQDFQLQNNITPVANVHRPALDNVRIHFYLACTDPSGNPTNGITRTLTNTGTFTSPTAAQLANPDFVEAFKQNGTANNRTGHAAWNTQQYLNIWVVGNILRTPNNDNLLGYSTFPPNGSASNGFTQRDGIVIWNQTFGIIGSDLTPNYNLGRTTTHEIGHFLNLIHIWGDDGTACTGSDEVADTPNQGSSTSGCVSVRDDQCSSTVMSSNYMDYTDDACMGIFTTGQTARARVNFEAGHYRQQLGARKAYILGLIGFMIAPQTTKLIRYIPKILAYLQTPTYFGMYRQTLILLVDKAQQV